MCVLNLGVSFYGWWDAPVGYTITMSIKYKQSYPESNPIMNQLVSAMAGTKTHQKMEN